MDQESLDLEECFRSGAQARAQGMTPADNPHAIRTPEHREWLAGWSATLDLDEDDDPDSLRVNPGLTDKDIGSIDLTPPKSKSGPLSD